MRWLDGITDSMDKSLSGLRGLVIVWKFMVHVLLKPGLENFEHYFADMCDEYNCAVV